MNIPEVAKHICAHELEIDTEHKGIMKIKPLQYIRLHGFKNVAMAIDKYLKDGKIKATWSQP